jgi:nucleoid-associated protein YgaU
MFARTLILVVTAAFLWAVFARPSGASGPEHSYRVKAGDTLWSIAAARYAGDPREGVWKIQQRNHLSGATITPGLKLVLPS